MWGAHSRAPLRNLHLRSRTRACCTCRRCSRDRGAAEGRAGPRGCAAAALARLHPPGGPGPGQTPPRGGALPVPNHTLGSQLPRSPTQHSARVARILGAVAQCTRAHSARFCACGAPRPLSSSQAQRMFAADAGRRLHPFAARAACAAWLPLQAPGSNTGDVLQALKYDPDCTDARQQFNRLKKLHKQKSKVRPHATRVPPL